MRPAMTLILFVSLCLAVMAAGGLLTAPGISSGWYANLVRPSWNPPAWVFGPVWTFLYISMGVAGWLVWREKEAVDIKIPMILFAVQLVLNVTWSGLFFYLRSPGIAAIEIVVLWLAVAATMVSFWKVSTVAGVLFVPYLAWTGFAVFLNAAIWRLNVN